MFYFLFCFPFKKINKISGNSIFFLNIFQNKMGVSPLSGDAREKHRSSPQITQNL